MWQEGFYFPSEEALLRIFFALKNPTASTGFEPANLGTKGQQDTSRLPKPLSFLHAEHNYDLNKYNSLYSQA
jgi:hypothetical protein